MSTVEDFFAEHDDWPWNPPRPGRATFHYLIHVTEGELLHDVDHVTRTVARGQWLWVRPGHALCWHPPGSGRGLFILFEPDVLTPDAARLLAPLTAHDAPAVLLRPDLVRSRRPTRRPTPTSGRSRRCRPRTGGG
ncbi:hypothetical protein OG806_48575 [Streptomyces sp. NBC_00882]|uniref:hypothetical protein n=1 Tax=Streptomyces TaxID=1883 RepID=UPI0038680606|nr:hypothetical protein OG806_48575 [Streptomyces sp. NBC_00882]WSZ63690.1 hypothetical protein OH824_47845 [Streptomyces canus]